MISILLVAELGLLRGALRAVLTHEGDLSVHEVGLYDDVLATARKVTPDVVVVDLDKDERAGLQATRRMVDELPECAVVVLSRQPTPSALRQALAAGVRGFTVRQTPPAELAGLIRRVAKGDRVIDPATALNALATVDNPLTPREREVLRLAARGLTTRMIAKELFLADGTVRNHVSAILRKTGCRNRMQAIRNAEDAGWI